MQLGKVLSASCSSVILLLQGKMSYVGSAQLTSIKVKRNQLPNIVAGLPNHQFGYVVHGNLVIYNDSSSYVLCSRSADGSVPAPLIFSCKVDGVVVNC